MINFILFADRWVRVEHISTVRFNKAYYLDEKDSAYITMTNGESLSAYGITQERLFASLGVPNAAV